jgi:hypothetical protein
MNAEEFIERLVNELHKEIDLLNSVNVMRNVGNMESLKYIIGKHDGLSVVLENIEKYLKKLQEVEIDDKK